MVELTGMLRQQKTTIMSLNMEMVWFMVLNAYFNNISFIS